MTLGAYHTQKETGTGRDYLRKLRDSERGRLTRKYSRLSLNHINGTRELWKNVYGWS